MSGTIVLLTLLWLVHATVSMPVPGQVSKRADDQNPLAAVVDKLSMDLLALKAEVQALKDANTPLVAFGAYISDEPRVHAAKGSSAPFRGVITNVGGGYSPLTSAFTAPLAGTYFFIVHADCSTDFRALQVTRNGQRVFSADNDNHDAHVTGSGVLSLHKGDVVSTKFYSDTGYLDAGNESTFSGFLVK